MSTVAPTRHLVAANGVLPARPGPPDSLTDLPSMADIYSLACFSAKFRFLVEVNYASVDESVETPVVPPAIDTCYASLNLTAERLKCAGVDEVALEAVSRAAQLIRDALLSDWLSPGHRERLDARARAEWADDRVASSRLDRFALTDSPFDPTGWTAYESAILSLEGSLDETRRDLFTLGRRLAAIRCPCPSTYDDGRGGLPALDIDLLSRGTARVIAGTISRFQTRTGLLRTVNPWLSPDETYKSAYELAEAIWDSLEATARQECPESAAHTGGVRDRLSGPPGTTCGPANPPPTDGAASGDEPPQVSEVGEQSVTDGSNNGTPPSGPNPSGPWWNRETYTLHDGDRPLRIYATQAANVIAILNAFEAERLKTGKWPDSVLLAGYEERQLRDAAVSLNKRLGEFEFKKSRIARTMEFRRRPASSGSTSD